MRQHIEDNLSQSVVGEISVEDIINKIKVLQNDYSKNVWRDILNEFLNLNESTEFYEEYDLSKHPEYYVNEDYLTGDFTLSEDLLNYNVTDEVRGFKYDGKMTLSHLIGIAKKHDSKILKQRIAEFIEELCGEVFITEDIDKIKNDFVGRDFMKHPSREDFYENKLKMIEVIVHAIKNCDNNYAFETYEDVQSITSRFKDLLNEYVKLDYDQEEVNKILNGDKKPEYTLKQIQNIINNENLYNNA